MYIKREDIFEMGDSYLVWLESTGWLRSKEATIKIPPSVIKKLYDELQKANKEKELLKFEVNKLKYTEERLERIVKVELGPAIHGILQLLTKAEHENY